MVQLSAIKLTRIVAEIHVIDAQRTDGRYLGNILTRLCPVEMGRVARQNDDTTGWRISLAAARLLAIVKPELVIDH